MPLPLPICTDDFRTVREAPFEYIDKTELICELIDNPGAQVALFPRPRRFGKTLNISMLRCFFQKSDEDLAHLFEGLRVWEAGDAYRKHFQRYPVIMLTFKECQYHRWEDCWDAIRDKVVDLFEEHRAVLESGRLSELEARRFRQILDGTATL
ncbi:AAA family ATPase [Polyangium aurulentum]|uniref:AAA family ATPase n=1 Tax=Polyangium aurulentum TaxID=2567896 RepID=UPI0010AE0533|nr:AAA family ATPase [Polyangium aurulentum]UQA61831.1 AAA family ATPase [Polyangium aurulentum]